MTLSHFAGLYQNRLHPIKALEFRTEAMNIINKRLGGVSTAIEDGTIGAVAALASYQATYGVCRTHNQCFRKLSNRVAHFVGFECPFTSCQNTPSRIEEAS